MHIVMMEFHHLPNLLTSSAVGSAQSSKPHTVKGRGEREGGRERERERRGGSIILYHCVVYMYLPKAPCGEWIPLMYG